PARRSLFITEAARHNATPASGSTSTIWTRLAKQSRRREDRSLSVPRLAPKKASASRRRWTPKATGFRSHKSCLAHDPDREGPHRESWRERGEDQPPLPQARHRAARRD